MLLVVAVAVVVGTTLARRYLPWWLSYFALVIVRDAIELPMSLSQSPCLVDDFMGGAKPPLRLKFKVRVSACSATWD